MTDKADMVPLVQAARLMRVPYGRAFNLVLQGRLSARQQSNGRWLVSMHDARKVAEELKREPPDG